MLYVAFFRNKRIEVAALSLADARITAAVTFVGPEKYHHIKQKDLSVTLTQDQSAVEPMVRVGRKAYFG